MPVVAAMPMLAEHYVHVPTEIARASKLAYSVTNVTGDGDSIRVHVACAIGVCAMACGVHGCLIRRKDGMLLEAHTAGMPAQTLERFELVDRTDVMRLVDVFYDRVRADDILGPIFDDVAHVDWAVHLPLMYDFWDSVLFSAGTYHGNPLIVHQHLAQRVPLTGREFARWLSLFESTVDDLFEGPMAEHARLAAARIATALQQRL
jgi:hemoglobin